VLLVAKVSMSMDGKGAWQDNVFVERVWHSVKYEEVYLYAYDSVSEARAFLGRYLSFYNERRPHSSLDGRTTDEAYFVKQEKAMAARPSVSIISPLWSDLSYPDAATKSNCPALSKSRQRTT
jgi:putative transposase